MPAFYDFLFVSGLIWHPSGCAADLFFGFLEAAGGQHSFRIGSKSLQNPFIPFPGPTKPYETPICMGFDPILIPSSSKFLKFWPDLVYFVACLISEAKANRKAAAECDMHKHVLHVRLST